MVQVTVARSIQEIEQLRPVWERLENSSGSTIFQSYIWNRTAATAFAERVSPYVVLAESSAGTALVPAAIQPREARITFLGDALFDYRNLLSEGSAEIQQAAWAKLAELRMPLALTALRGTVRETWSALGPRLWVNAPQIALCECGPEQLAAAHRRLGRFWRRALRSGAELREYDGSAATLLRWIYRQKAEQLGPSPENLFVDKVRIDFMVAVAGAEPTRCDIFVLEKGGGVMAALVTFRDGHARRFYTVFYDHKFAHYSPGNILLFEICRRTLERGWDCDLMTGEQHYKQRLATSVVPLFKVDASPEMLTAAALRDPATEVAA